MKVTVEIIGEEVKYSYDVGTTKSEATTKFSADWLEAFTDILRLAHRAWSKTNDDRTREAIWSARDDAPK